MDETADTELSGEDRAALEAALRMSMSEEAATTSAEPEIQEQELDLVELMAADDVTERRGIHTLRANETVGQQANASEATTAEQPATPKQVTFQ